MLHSFSRVSLLLLTLVILANCASPTNPPVTQGKGVQGTRTTPKPFTRSDIDALRAQLEKCWEIPASAMDTKNMAVEMKIEVNPNRTVKSAEIVDQKRYRADKLFAHAADAARRSTLNCSPLALPPDKYEAWKIITLKFDPTPLPAPPYKR